MAEPLTEPGDSQPFANEYLTKLAQKATHNLLHPFQVHRNAGRFYHAGEAGV